MAALNKCDLRTEHCVCENGSPVRPQVWQVRAWLAGPWGHNHYQRNQLPRKSMSHEPRGLHAIASPPSPSATMATHKPSHQLLLVLLLELSHSSHVCESVSMVQLAYFTTLSPLGWMDIYSLSAIRSGLATVKACNQKSFSAGKYFITYYITNTHYLLHYNIT